MGSTRKGWLSMQEAAATLGCSIEVAQEIAQHGSIRRITDGDRVFLRAEDIEEVLRLSGGAEMSKPDMQKRIIFLEQQVRRLQEAVELMFQVNQMSSTTLDPMDNDTLLLLYSNIQGSLQESAWPIQRILSCAEIFLRIGEDEIDRLNHLAETETSWRPFYELCAKQIRYVTTHEDFPVDINLQRCRDILIRGRNNLRSIAIIFIEMSASLDTSFSMLARLASTDIQAFDDLVKQLKGRSPKTKLELL